MPAIAARILRELDHEGLLATHLIVAGTNALFAYEAATGTVLPTEHVATTDADLLWDTKQSLLLAATGVRREGIMGILRRVDRSFVADYGFNARNDDGYIVDLLCPETDDMTTIKIGDDLEATPMPGTGMAASGPSVRADDHWRGWTTHCKSLCRSPARLRSINYGCRSATIAAQ